jgi:enediyne biosynthesis protein CalE5
MEFEGDVESMVLERNSFNAIISRWGLMFLPNPQSSLKSMREALVSGGRISAAVWTEPEKSPTVSMPIGVARQILDLSPMPKTAPPFNLADAKMLERVFEETGLKNIQTERMTLTFKIESVDEFARFQSEVNGPIIALLAEKSEDKRKEVWNAIIDAASKYSGSDGKVTINNEVLCIAGERD